MAEPTNRDAEGLLSLLAATYARDGPVGLGRAALLAGAALALAAVALYVWRQRAGAARRAELAAAAPAPLRPAAPAPASAKPPTLAGFLAFLRGESA